MFVTAIVALTGIVATAPIQDPGLDALRLIRDHNRNWPRTITFVQHTHFPDGHVETWYESMAAPGRLRIDRTPLDQQRAVIFRADSQYTVAGGAVQGAVPLVHVLLVLAYDARVDPVERTAARLREVGFDLSRGYETEWEGRPVLVVGAEQGDTTSNQFWVDRERGVTVRVIHAPAGRPADFRLGGFVRVADGWMETRVEFIRGGRLLLREEYEDIHPNVRLDPAVFVPGHAAPAWIPR